MKTIKIFLASSEELKNDRVSFGNFIRELDKRYQQRGIRIDLYTWEGADGAYNGRRKQDEYNDNVRDSDMLVVLFYIKAGSFTQEEFHEAVKSFNETGRPKVYVYFRQLEDESKISNELKKFKEELEGQDARGHFAFRYNNDDSLHLDFVMQLLMQDKIQKDELNIEEGQVMLNGMVIAQMDNLKFATDNKGNQDLIKDLEKIETELNEIRQALDQNPNIDFIKKQYEQKRNEYNQKKEELEKHQKNLLNTAIRIVNLQKDHITDETKRAIEAFNSGDAPRADFLLDEAEHNTKQIRDQLLAAKEVAYQKIEQLLLHASFKINNTTIPIDERIEQTQKKYEEAISLAKESGYDNEKNAELIEKFGDFLQEYNKYKEALEFRKELVGIRRKVYGENHAFTAIAYSKLGFTLDFNNLYDESLESLQKALNILEKQQDDKYKLEIAEIYNNLGNAYNNKEEYKTAMEWHYKALEIRLIIGENTFDVARSYNNIGNVYRGMGKSKEALTYFLESIKIRETILDRYDKRLARSYYNITFAYADLCMYDKIIDYLKKACIIYEETLGKTNSTVSDIYNKIGYAYRESGDYTSAFNWYTKATSLGNAGAMCSLGWLFELGNGVEQDYSKAIYWYQKSAEKGNRVAQSNMGTMFEYGKGVTQDYSIAAEWYKKSADQGYADGQLYLGILYEGGNGVEKNESKAVELYELAAKQGNPNAQACLGFMYMHGRGIKKDEKKGVEWYQKSAEQGYPRGQFLLGCSYEEGEGVEQNYKLAFEWYKKSADQDYPDAQCNLGVLYSNGWGVEQDTTKSIELFTKAAEQEDEVAQYNLACRYFWGKDVGQNYSIAAEWYQKSAENDYEEAYNELAWTLHLLGRYEVALPWAEKAVEVSPEDPNVIDTLATIYQGLGRYNDALQQFELCLKLYKEQDISDGIHETEEKIAALKELMNSKDDC
jgi:TPR repeat protein